MQGLQRALQAVVARGDGDQVDVVGHQAIGEDRDVMVVAVGLQPIEIDAATGVGEENALAAVAALGHVMRQAGKDSAGDAGHQRSIAEDSEKG